MKNLAHGKVQFSLFEIQVQQVKEEHAIGRQTNHPQNIHLSSYQWIISGNCCPPLKLAIMQVHHIHSTTAYNSNPRFKAACLNQMFSKSSRLLKGPQHQNCEMDCVNGIAKNDCDSDCDSDHDYLEIDFSHHEIYPCELAKHQETWLEMGCALEKDFALLMSHNPFSCEETLFFQRICYQNALDNHHCSCFDSCSNFDCGS